MKLECVKCPIGDKSKGACQKRQCKYSEPLPVVVVPVPPRRFPMVEDEEIDAGSFGLLVEHCYENGDFDALIVSLDEKSEKHGSFGSYVTEGRHYHFVLLREDKGEELLWEIPDWGTERFHREGSTGAQFLLYWFKESGFSGDLDS